MSRPNLTVETRAFVTRILFEGSGRSGSSWPAAAGSSAAR